MWDAVNRNRDAVGNFAAREGALHDISWNTAVGSLLPGGFLEQVPHRKQLAGCGNTADDAGSAAAQGAQVAT